MQTIREVMTTVPLTVDESTSLATVERLFSRYQMRHLPVTHQGNLSGILFARDVEAVLKLHNVSHEEQTIALIVNRHPRQVAPNVGVKDLIQEMAQKKIEAVVVVDGGKVIGIFTVIDALHMLEGLL